MRFVILGILIGLFIGVMVVYVLLAYLPQDEASLPNSVKRGVTYFNGNITFSNGGRPCIGCHSIASMGLRGTDLAPDLSKAFLGPPSWSEPLPDFEGDESKLKDFLTRPSTGTMQLIWQQNPLTDDEVEVLVELLKYASREG